MATVAQSELPRNRQHTNSDRLIVAEWPINKRESARISIELYNGVWLVNLRKWFKADDGEMRPGKSGIALNVKHLPRLTEAATKALTIARERGLIAADHEGDQ